MVSKIQKSAAKSQNVESDYTLGPCSPVQFYPTQYFISSNYEGPEMSMTVGEAERLYESDSEKNFHEHNGINYSNQQKCY